MWKSKIYSQQSTLKMRYLSEFLYAIVLLYVHQGPALVETIAMATALFRNRPSDFQPRSFLSFQQCSSASLVVRIHRISKNRSTHQDDGVRTEWQGDDRTSTRHSVVRPDQLELRDCYHFVSEYRCQRETPKSIERTHHYQATYRPFCSQTRPTHDWPNRPRKYKGDLGGLALCIPAS